MHVWPQWLLCSSPWACVLPVAIGWAAGALSLQGRALERVALAKARSELLARGYALKLRESLTIGDWAAHDLGRDRALRLWLRQTAAYGAARTYSDGSCDVAVRLAPAAIEQKLEALSATSGATADGAVATPDFSLAACEWPVLWAQGTAWPTEAELAQQPEGWEDVTPVGLEMTRRAAEADALGFFGRQSAAGALADQVALDFRRHTQYHRHDLGLEAAVELPVAFGGVNSDALLGALG